MTATQGKEPGLSMTATQIKEGPLTVAPPIASTVAGAAWNPFSLMDRLDADALVAEMQGIASDVLVYKIKEGGKETVGLSKQGVDECCTMLVQQGQCIREMSIEHEFIGEGDNREALFKCIAARFAVHADGREVRMDQVIGVKREPMYEDRAPLTLDSRVPGKRWKDRGRDGKPLTYGEAIDPDHPVNAATEDDQTGNGAIGYLHWIVEQSNFDDATKQFVAALLSGVDVQEWAAGKRFNPFWYEHGAMKAARNARFRLVPAEVKAAVIALAKQTNREREVEQAEVAAAAAPPPRRAGGRAKARVVEQPPRELRREPKRAAYKWLFAPYAGVAIDAMTEPGNYIIPDADLEKGLKFAERGLSGAEVRKGDGTKGVLDEQERVTVHALKAEIENEIAARIAHREELLEAKRDHHEGEPPTSETASEDRAARTDARPT